MGVGPVVRVGKKATPMATLHRSIVVLGKITTVPLLIALARAVVQAMTTNKSTFPTPNPPLPQVTTDANALDTAQLATKSKTKGTVATRDEARTVLVADLHQLQAYVQQIADASPEHAAVIIQSAGMSVRKTAPRNKSDSRRQGEQGLGLDGRRREGGPKARVARVANQPGRQDVDERAADPPGQYDHPEPHAGRHHVRPPPRGHQERPR